MADVGVYRIGEIDRRRAGRQREEVALRREAEDLVGKHLEPGMLEEFFRARRVLEDFQELPEPAVLLPLRKALLVLPVCSDAEFRNLVHRPGANLAFDALVFGSDEDRKRVV